MANSEKKFDVFNEKDKIEKSYVKKQSAIDYATKHIGYYVVRIKNGEIVYKNEAAPISDEPITTSEEQVECEIENIEAVEETTVDITVEVELEENTDEETSVDITVEVESIEEEEVVEKQSAEEPVNIESSTPAVRVYKKKSLLKRIIDFILSKFC